MTVYFKGYEIVLNNMLEILDRLDYIVILLFVIALIGGIGLLRGLLQLFTNR